MTNTKEIISWKPWRAEKGGVYYSVNCQGTYGSPEDNDVLDRYRYYSGNYYETREEAKYARLVRFAKRRLDAKMLELNEGWIPDWKDFTQNKYIFCYNHKTNKWLPNTYTKVLQSFNNYYFPTKKLTQKFIRNMEVDLELVFNIK